METAFLNIHTHKPRKDEVSVLNLDLETSCPIVGLASLGIHPWSLDDAQSDSAKALRLLEERLQDSNVVALGEAGLDRLHEASFAKQMEVFESQIVLSERLSKPLIIHNVKCNNEMIALRKKHKPKQAWILHGYNGTEQDVVQLAKNGFCFSVGEGLLHTDRKICKSIAEIPIDRLFFETDMADIEVVDVYRAAAEILGMPINALRDKIFANFAHYFEYADGKLARQDTIAHRGARH